MHPFTIVAELPTLNINANEWTSGLASAVGPWIAGGLGVGIVILTVVLGWRKLHAIVDDEGLEDAFDAGPEPQWHKEQVAELLYEEYGGEDGMDI